MRTMSRLARHPHPACPTYVLTDRLHRERTVCVTAEEITDTVSTWLATLGVQTPLVDELCRMIRDGAWAQAHAIADMLSVDVTVA
ncbi:hypothetical protein [Mycolicibacterium psychrotolerans]|nr:hypothetical protein [Mycolicibacterium psychrotolerans]